MDSDPHNTELIEIPGEDYSEGHRKPGDSDSADAKKVSPCDERRYEREQPCELYGQHNTRLGQHYEIIIGKFEKNTKTGEQRKPKQSLCRGRPPVAIYKPDKGLGAAAHDQADWEYDCAQQSHDRCESGTHRDRITLKSRKQCRCHIANRLGEHIDWEAGKVPAQYVEAERCRTKYVTRDEVVDVPHEEHNEAGPSKRQPEMHELPGMCSVKPEAKRYWRKDSQQDGTRCGPGHLSYRQAHRAEPANRQNYRYDRSQPAVDLIDDQLPVLPEMALQDRGGYGGPPVGDDNQGYYADDRSTGRRPHRPSEGRRGKECTYIE
jgi:hypothetical protein